MENVGLRKMGDEDNITLKRKDFLRVLKMFAIHEKHISDLFRQTFGIKNFEFDGIMKEIAEDFGVTFEEIDNVKFARFEIGK